MFGGRQADVDVDAERFGDLGAQVLAEGAAGDAADDFAEDEAEGDHVIALRGAGLPPRFGRRRGGRTPRPSRGSLRGVQAGAGSDDAGAVAHHHGDGDVLLSGLAEFGPVLGDGGVQVELAAIGQQVNAGAGQAF